MKEILSVDGFSIAFDKNRPYVTDSDAETVDYNSLTPTAASETEKEFLDQQFPDTIDLTDLKLDPHVTPILQSRIDEAQACPREKVSLGTILLLGSTLEGMLLGVALKDPKPFMTATSAPKLKGGLRVKSLADWKLAELIDVACQVGLVGLDVKKFSHELRDFRNYIHPYHQMSQNFNPTQHTVDICWQVFKAAYSQLKEKTP